MLEYLDDKQKIEKLEYSPLWHHKRNLLQTATGYGSKLVTPYKVAFNGRLYRVYCMIYSNVGSCYIISKGKKLFLRYDTYDIKEA